MITCNVDGTSPLAACLLAMLLLSAAGCGPATSPFPVDGGAKETSEELDAPRVADSSPAGDQADGVGPREIDPGTELPIGDLCESIDHYDAWCFATCLGETELGHYSPVECGYDCCSGYSHCELYKKETCPPGEVCILAEDEWADDECGVPTPECPAGVPGEVAWTFQADAEIRGMPAVDEDGTLYFGTLAATVYAVDCHGDELWTWTKPCTDWDCPQAIEGAATLDGGGGLYLADDIMVPNYLFFLETSGDPLWIWENSLVYGTMDASPTLGPDHVVWVAGHGMSGYSGGLGMIAAVDGQGVALPGFPMGTDRVLASPVVTGNRLVFAETNGDVNVSAVTPGAEVLWTTAVTPGGWKGHPGSLAVDPEGMIVAAAVTDMGGDMQPILVLMRLHHATGEVLWQVALPVGDTRPVGAPVIRDAAFGFEVAASLADGTTVLANPYSGGVMVQTLLDAVDSYGNDVILGGPAWGADGALYVPRTAPMEPSSGPAVVRIEPGSPIDVSTWIVGEPHEKITSSLQLAPGGMIYFGTSSGRLVAWRSPATGPEPGASWPTAHHDPFNTGRADTGCVPCSPDCEGRECGDDGCGGSCGECDDSLFCEWPGMCVNGDPPQCFGKMCGPDSMGGSCGSCPTDWLCDMVGHCHPPDGACEGVAPTGGMCHGGWLGHCDDGEMNWSHCKYDGCVVQEAGPAICQPVPCLPDCFGRECGDDGCGGSCGVCPDGAGCHETLGVCALVPGGCEALVEGTESACLGHVRIQCSDGGDVFGTDCTSLGQVCGPEDCEGPGTCRPLWPWLETCEGLPPWGACRGDRYFFCKDGWLEVTHCASEGPYTCTRTGMESMGCELK